MDRGYKTEKTITKDQAQKLSTSTVKSETFEVYQELQPIEYSDTHKGELLWIKTWVKGTSEKGYAEASKVCDANLAHRIKLYKYRGRRVRLAGKRKRKVQEAFIMTL